MNGAIAEPWLKIIKAPNKAKTKKIGNSQYFFRIIKNWKNSLINEIILKIKIYKFIRMSS